MIGKWIATGIILLIAYVAYKVIVESIIRTANKLKKPLKMPNTLRLIVGVIIALIAVMVIMDVWGKSLTGLIASLGIGGIIVGLALQEPLSNLAAGFMLLMSGALKEGDTINIAGYSGTVRGINVNHTVIDTFDGKRVLIPNRTVWAETLINYWPTPVRRLEMDIGVSYSSDLKKVVRLLEKCMEEVDLIEKEPAPYVVFDGFKESSINFKVRFWVRRENYFDAQMQLALKIKEIFDREGIEIPFPQLDVHMKS